MYHSDPGITVLLDLKKTYSDNKRSAIEMDISRYNGVSHAGFSRYVPRVMFIHYDRNITTPLNIRNKVNELLDADAPTTNLVSM